MTFDARILPLLSSLRQTTHVNVILPDDARYESARLVYNRMHDHRPALIVQTLDVDALTTILRFVADSGMPFAIRGGGHHIGGFSTCDDGIVIDFSPFRKVVVDTRSRVAYVQPGTRLGDFDEALTSQGFVVPTGTVSETGIAGLTLGGGIGWLVGTLGLTCDHLCGADVLLASGEVVRAEAPEHKDLLWALRGGGGNFGIVLQFRYRLNRLPQTICGSGYVSWSDAAGVLGALVDYCSTKCPESISVAPVFFKDEAGDKFLRIDFCHSGEDAREIDELQSLFKTVDWRDVRPWLFKDWQRSTDQAFLPAMRGYWKASYTEKITPEMQRNIIEAFADSPSRDCSILIEHLHGAFKRVDQSQSAFHLRKANFGILFSARWPELSEDTIFKSWVQRSFRAVDPAETSQTYSNYSFKDDERVTRGLINVSDSRIVKVKTAYDPGNLFRTNHNIVPMPSAGLTRS